jgi:ribosomal-protein-alanine N-acetyltransferase
MAGLAAASRRGSVLFPVAVYKGRVVGYAIGEMAGPELHLTNLAVAVPFRMRNIGRRLVANLETLGRERGAQEIWLEVREHNEVAIAFYESLGYLTQGRRRAYYRDPCEDALLMSKPLVLAKD